MSYSIFGYVEQKYQDLFVKLLELTNHGYMRIIMLNNIYKHYLEIIFKIRKEKGEDNMAKKLFTTIYGRNLVGELKKKGQLKRISVQ